MKNFSKIFLMIFLTLSKSGFSQLVPDFRVNDDTTTQLQYNAKIGVDELGNFVVVWTDWREEAARGVNTNVYCQRFSPSAEFIGNNFRINEITGFSSSPDIAVREDGSFLVCWKEFGVKVRIFDNQGIPLGPTFSINDSVANQIYNTPKAGTDSAGNFVICWHAHVFAYGDIYFQRLDSSGNKIGSNTKVNDDTVYVENENPSISVKADGSFIITWNDFRPPAIQYGDDIYFQMYDSFGNPIGVNQKVNDDFGILNLQRSPKISSDLFGNFVIGWSDTRLSNNESEIFSQMYNNNGIKIGINFRVSQSSTNFGKGICNVFTKPTGEFLVAWGEARPFIPKPYFQRYNPEGITIGANYLVTNENPSTDKFYSDVEIYNDKIISVWSDERNGPFDVYCNIRSFTNPDSTVNIIQISSLIPNEFSLYQNFPNPFNSATVIQFDITDNNNYKLDLYNELGQNVKTIFNNYLNTGTYKINFTSGELNSGVYYYILSSPKVRVVKSLMLIK